MYNYIYRYIYIYYPIDIDLHIDIDLLVYWLISLYMNGIHIYKDISRIVGDSNCDFGMVYYILMNQSGEMRKGTTLF